MGPTSQTLEARVGSATVKQFLDDTRHQRTSRISACTREQRRIVSLFESVGEQKFRVSFEHEGKSEKPEVTVLWNEAKGLLREACHLSLEGRKEERASF